MSRRAVIAAVAAAASAALVTLLAVVVPEVHFAFRNPSLRVALETAAALIALVAAQLAWGRLRREHALRDLALVGGLGLIAATNLFFMAIPVAFGGSGGRFAPWSTAFGTTLGAILLALGAWLGAGPARRLTMRRVLGGWLLVFGLVGAAGAAMAALADPGIPSMLGRADSTLITGHPALLASQIVSAAALAIAAVGYAIRSGDASPLLRWLPTALALGAVARVSYVLFPSLYSEWVSIGDVLRFGFYLALLAGAAAEIASIQRAAVGAAVLEERRRIARNLHDGLAQELSFVATESARGEPRLELLRPAAERALDESRAAIAALTEPLDEPLADGIERAAGDVAARHGARLVVTVAPNVALMGPAREDVLRIVREAVTNAARHGRATLITVDVSGRELLRLRVRDDGIGLRDATRSVGFGLVSMRERAHALGGTLHVGTHDDGGVDVELVVPQT